MPTTTEQHDVESERQTSEPDWSFAGDNSFFYAKELGAPSSYEKMLQNVVSPVNDADIPGCDIDLYFRHQDGRLLLRVVGGRIVMAAVIPDDRRPYTLMDLDKDPEDKCDFNFPGLTYQTTLRVQDGYLKDVLKTPNRFCLSSD